MWVWPKLVFGRSPPSPLVIGGPFPQAKPLPSPPSPSLFPTPLALFARLQEGRPRLVGGRGPRAQGGEGGGASKRHLGPDPHLGVLDLRPVIRIFCIFRVFAVRIFRIFRVLHVFALWTSSDPSSAQRIF